MFFYKKSISYLSDTTVGDVLVVEKPLKQLSIWTLSKEKPIYAFPQMESGFR